MATDRKRGFATAGDMVRSLSVVGIFVLALVLLTFRQHDDPTKAIDYSDTLRGARSAASYAVLAPDPMPSGWRATSARTEPSGPGVHWHLGMLTDDEQYAAIEQSDGGDPRFVRQTTEKGLVQGEIEIAGRRWQQLRSDEKRQNSLVSTSGGVDTVITGTASVAQLKTLVTALTTG